jgi:anti-sigma-K factor RskA
MNAEQRQIMLIDYAEGTLPKDQLADLEALLEHSADARRELDLIRSAFQQLNAAPDVSVPDHYFSAFLPRLRQRIEKRSFRTWWTIPAYVETLFRPAMAAAGLVILVASYQLFEPQPTGSPLYDLVRDCAQDELSAVLNEPSVFATVSDETIGEVSLGSEAFGADISQYQSENDLSVLLEEKEFEQVVQQLETKGIQ